MGIKSRVVMTALVTIVLVVLLGTLWNAALLRGQAGAAASAPPNAPPMTAEEFDRMFQQHKNWGRWGKDDKMGALNLITEQKRRQAVALVKNGISVSIAHDLSTVEALDNPRPFGHVMNPNFRTDVYTSAYHGTFTTHLDALCHFVYQDKMYNDVPASASNEKGCANGVENLKDGVITRGILIDIPRLRGVPYVDPQTAISAGEIEAWEKKAGVKISAGDAIILRTGRWARRAALGPWRAMGNAAGLHANVGAWLRQRDIALGAGDTTLEAQIEGGLVLGLGPGIANQPLHTFLIAGLGVPLIDDVDPEALAETAARLNRWEFLFVVAPLRVPGGTGGPVNPIAIF